MTPQARQIIREVATRRGIDPAKIAGKCRAKRVFYARVEVAKRLDARGYSSPRIGAMLGGHDHTTIVYYLGRGKKKPKPEPVREWKSPRVRLLKWLIPRRERDVFRGMIAKRKRDGRRKRLLVPYAGADMTEYQWKERVDADAEAHSR